MGTVTKRIIMANYIQKKAKKPIQKKETTKKYVQKKKSGYVRKKK